MSILEGRKGRRKQNVAFQRCQAHISSPEGSDGAAEWPHAESGLGTSVPSVPHPEWWGLGGPMEEALARRALLVLC